MKIFSLKKRRRPIPPVLKRFRKPQPIDPLRDTRTFLEAIEFNLWTRRVLHRIYMGEDMYTAVMTVGITTTCSAKQKRLRSLKPLFLKSPPELGQYYDDDPLDCTCAIGDKINATSSRLRRIITSVGSDVARVLSLGSLISTCFYPSLMYKAAGKPKKPKGGKVHLAQDENDNNV